MWTIFKLFITISCSLFFYDLWTICIIFLKIHSVSTQILKFILQKPIVHTPGKIKISVDPRESCLDSSCFIGEETGQLSLAAKCWSQLAAARWFVQSHYHIIIIFILIKPYKIFLHNTSLMNKIIFFVFRGTIVFCIHF